MSQDAIKISILAGGVHFVAQILLLLQEKFANRTTFMNYLSVSFNGRLGYVPFTDILCKPFETSSPEQNNLGYDGTGSFVLCFPCIQDFTFTEGTLAVFVRHLTTLPIEEDSRKRRDVVMGRCLANVSFSAFMNLVEMADKRVNLVIHNLDVMDLTGAVEQV